MYAGEALYKLEDYAGDPVEGRYYEEELQLVNVGADDIYQIEKVISSRKRRGQHEEYLETFKIKMVSSSYSGAG